jgi:hypothetical protein
MVLEDLKAYRGDVAMLAWPPSFLTPLLQALRTCLLSGPTTGSFMRQYDEAPRGVFVVGRSGGRDVASSGHLAEDCTRESPKCSKDPTSISNESHEYSLTHHVCKPPAEGIHASTRQLTVLTIVMSM